MAYLSLFTFFMLMLVTADNLLQLFFGWEGVGLASYLLIGFWYDKPSANAAAIKAFIVNRVGDFGFALGIFAVFLLFDSVQFDDDLRRAPRDRRRRRMHFLGMRPAGARDRACLLLFIGAMGKSAQLGLHTWLPDAMEGPTPVSALIHAATMVTAGVFMVAGCRRCSSSRRRLDGRDLHRRHHRVLRRHDRPHPVRHQAGDRLLDLLAARLHVLRLRRRRLFGGDVPPLHPRLLQGAAVPGRGLGDPRHVHEQDMRKMGGIWRRSRRPTR